MTPEADGILADSDRFMIECDYQGEKCFHWYHGNCVGITPAEFLNRGITLPIRFNSFQGYNDYVLPLMGI